ncbi:hypothetical protein [Snodgrassella alvi]|uniref:hypothetical protein n=1 Tax=Snodgrassella alvi TaxID=1196083 RepID=UPI0015D545EA|nr:hypothetical protein [Snodgrassella alvi]
MPEAEKAEARKRDAASHMVETSITLSDGRKITCLIYRSRYYGSGLSCDWHNTPQPKQP